MREEFVEVLLEVPVKELATLHDPTQELYEAMRIAADRKCAEVGRRVHAATGPVEVRVQEARHPLIGDMTLVASRWRVES
jgi:hypothetical protein